MSIAKHHVTIKGVKDGLVFLLDDSCEFESLIEELEYKLDKSHQQILTGPIIHVRVKLGKRMVTKQQKDKIRSIISRQGNLLIQSIESDDQDDAALKSDKTFHVSRGIVRSGQTLKFKGDVLYIGDINPGGTIECTGSIYVLGSVRGVIHAGCEGDNEAIIAAAHLKPTQLRISSVISRPPDEWGVEEAYMEFAYLKQGQMEIDKVTQVHRIRPESQLLFKGV